METNDDDQSCDMCRGGALIPLGQLGDLLWWRCQHCHWETFERNGQRWNEPQDVLEAD